MNFGYFDSLEKASAKSNYFSSYGVLHEKNFDHFNCNLDPTNLNILKSQVPCLCFQSSCMSLFPSFHRRN